MTMMIDDYANDGDGDDISDIASIILHFPLLFPKVKRCSTSVIDLQLWDPWCSWYPTGAFGGPWYPMGSFRGP